MYSSSSMSYNDDSYNQIPTIICTFDEDSSISWKFLHGGMLSQPMKLKQNVIMMIHITKCQQLYAYLMKISFHDSSLHGSMYVNQWK